MSAGNMRTVKENIYFIRSLTQSLYTGSSKCPSLGINVLRCRQISNAVNTCRNDHNKHDFIHNNFLFVKNNVKFYSKKFDDVRIVMNFYEFTEVENKDKQTFNEMIKLYEQKFPGRKGVVDFIYAALKNMKAFGVHEDLETYKKLINLMPKGKYVPTNIFQSEGIYHPREQYCIVDLLCQMEDCGVIPDVDMHDMLVSIFGPLGLPTKKFYRMMYWMPKFKNLSPWLLPRPLPKETFALAKLAIEKITSADPQTEIISYRTEDIEDSIDKTWIVSGQSQDQRRLLQKHDPSKPVIVEGGDHVWLHDQRISYFVLKSEEVSYVWKEPKFIGDVENLPIKYLNPNYQEEEEDEERSVHEQEDGTIYAVCATGTSSKDSLLSWIRLLEKNGNAALENLAVLFRFKTPPHKPVPYTDALTTENEKRESV